MQHTNTETGVVMLDLKGLTVEVEERQLLTHPAGWWCDPL